MLLLFSSNGEKFHVLRVIKFSNWKVEAEIGRELWKNEEMMTFWKKKIESKKKIYSKKIAFWNCIVAKNVNFSKNKILKNFPTNWNSK